MPKTFIDKLNIKFKDKFTFLRLKDTIVNVRDKYIELVLIFPEYINEISDSDKLEIEQASGKILNTTLPVRVKFIKSHFDKDIFKREFLEFLTEFPSISSILESSDIIIDQERKAVTVLVEPTIFRFCLERDIVKSIDGFITNNYCDTITFAFRQKETDEIGDILEESEAPKTHLEHKGDRLIIPKNVDNLIGKPIYNKAMYIEDAVSENPEAVICGTVSDITVIEYKDKKTGEGKRFYKILLSDPTGKMEVLYFPNKFSMGKIELLKAGKEIVVRGKLEADKKREGGLVFMVRDISYCSIDKDFVVNRFVRDVDSEYRTIFPVDYVEASQTSFFDMATAVPKSLLSKTFVVFDLETTGLNPKQEKIVEIGAVKIVNGIITQSFSTLVNPQKPIPIGATEVHGIKDSDVINKPAIENVLPDFYKFVQGSTLVAHNISFDFSFISELGRAMGIYFENEMLDTLALARKTFPGLSHYNLPFLTKYFNIVHESKHRAVDDAVATAKLFLKIAEKNVL